MTCANCHHQRSVAGQGTPPGVKGDTWRMAPRHMAFQGKSARQLALLFKNPRRSFMDGHALLQHAEEDALLKTAWTGAGGREKPPHSHEDFFVAFYTWIEAGMPVPEEKKEQEAPNED